MHIGRERERGRGKRHHPQIIHKDTRMSTSIPDGLNTRFIQNKQPTFFIDDGALFIELVHEKNKRKTNNDPSNLV